MARLYLEETGLKKGPALLFVHGWTCTHETMAPLVKRFEATHRCLSVDLLGHGASPKARRYDIADQCDAIAETCPLSDTIVIGHSMGGQIALELAARGDVRASVLLDPAPIIPHDKARQWGEDLRVKLRQVDIPAMMEAFARNQFKRAVEPGVVNALVKTMQSCDPEVTIGAWDGIMDFDGPAALARLDRPTLVIFANQPLNDVRAFAKSSDLVETAQTACSGHMQQLEVPEQLEAMIRRFEETLD